MSSNAFKRPQDRYGESTPAETPYHRAAQAWDERIGSARVQARSWRMMAFGCLVLAGLSTGAFLYVQLKRPIATYAIPFDRYGQPGRVELVDRAYRPDDAIKASFVREFVERVRSKSTDPVVLRDNWTRATRMTNQAARASLVQYGQDHDPAARLGQEAIAVEIASVLPRSPTTFQVQWRETIYLQGVAGPPVRWTGLFTLGPRPPKTEAELFGNPRGLEITSFQWSRDL
ncbi:conjugal transfer protein TrbF [Caulobacter sp. Root342]|jgi:type IV secretion system protein TrbF|uniref:conjugal transfer protein TrbF n=1 Tax=Caulobacter sp. Root342 TaxID=1736519 RepID=UPI0006F1D961|nr:conjugal transfer protein TrbF [Caulobacter sp. Root342]KQV54649.1 conjugal transfer protein TrbF [Caulobacter sp. Root342]